jgi:hypothetical protein
MTWLILHDATGYRLIDSNGTQRGCYRSANELATHLALALDELDTLRHQIATDRFFAFLERASAEVATWPEWKARGLG